MKIIDITQELVTCAVFPGDLKPSAKKVLEIKNGDIVNLTNIFMCAHNGTHIDAPYHFIENGKTIDELDLSIFFGECTVACLSGIITADEIKPVLKNSKPRLLLKGELTLSAEAAREIVACGIKLVGVESQTIGVSDAPKEVHMILLENGVIPLEGIRLSEAGAGDYVLCAFPINIKGSDGSPCRAVLIEN